MAREHDDVRAASASSVGVSVSWCDSNMYECMGARYIAESHVAISGNGGLCKSVLNSFRPYLAAPAN